MPRKSKENERKDELKTEEIKKSVSISKSSKQKNLQDSEKSVSSKSSVKKTTKASSSKKSKSTKEFTTIINPEESNSKKSASNKKTKTTSNKKSEATKTNTKKNSTTRKASTTKKSSSNSKSSTSKRKIEVLEYYDLPYRYNQTIVKVLSQTPTTLFVYWDISDTDRQNLINEHGEKFFEETKPFLIIHNETNNYSFEVEINDFANSWYLHIPDSKCIYNIELGRKPIKNNQSINQNLENYIYITSSNKMEAPNDHILFDSLGDTVYFRNVKTNIIEEKKITSLSFIQNIGKIYNIYDIYQKIYPVENIKYFDLNNPSSGERNEI